MLRAGSQLGAYEIIALLGAGGMGEVYTLIDRSGARKPLNVPPGPYVQPRISPDGKQLAVYADDGTRPYDITPDGKYVVALLPRAQAEPGKAPPEQINVTLNWFEELKQRAPAR